MYEKFLVAWLQPFEFLTLIIIVSFFVIIFLYLKDSIRKSEINFDSINTLMLITLILFFLVVVIITPFMNLRYWYTLHPVFLIFITYIVYRFALLFGAKKFHGIIPCCSLILILILSKDYNFKHLSSIDSIEASFRINYPGKLAETYYFKEDYESPAKVIKENMSNDDLIITTVAPIEYYLPKLDYYYRSYKDNEFEGRSRDKGTIEVWTNSRLIYKENQLIKLLDNSTKNIWLITYSSKRPGVPEFDKELITKYYDNFFIQILIESLDVFYIRCN